MPTLLAPFRNIDDDSITAVERIALNSDGTKRGRRMLGIVRRAAIKFDEIGPAGELVVGEGIETCMAARQLGLARRGRSAASASMAMPRMRPMNCRTCARSFSFPPNMSAEVSSAISFGRISHAASLSF